MDTVDNAFLDFVTELQKLPAETEWIEFKKDNSSPDEIAEYLSALANSATLHQRDESYLIFGIDDKSHEVIGTKFNPYTKKGKGAEDLIPWLHRSLNHISFTFKEFNHPKGKLVIFFISPSSLGPVKFKNKAWIRVGLSLIHI